MPVSWAAMSHPGRHRSTNEDSYCARPDLGLFVVADGMGGHAGGEVASRVAVEVIERVVADTPASVDPSAAADESGPTDDARRLLTAFRDANRHIADTAASSIALRGMATTASAVLCREAGATVAHVGDSRVYLLRAGRLERLTDDHSWVEEQVRAGAMSATVARRHPWRNVVTRALSGGEDAEADVRAVALEGADRVLLCSDGLNAVLGDGSISAILERVEPLEAVCQALVEAANGNGGPDNITVVVLEIDAP